MCSACLLHPMSVNQLHSTKLVVRVFSVCRDTCSTFSRVWQYMCVYTGYATVHVEICDSTCVCTLDIQLHQQPYKHFFSHCHHQVQFTVWLKYSLLTAIFYNWPTPKFQPLCYHRLKNLCMKILKKNLLISWQLKTCWFHIETILSHTHTKGFTINIMFMFMRSLFFTHLFIVLAEMFECPNLFPQYALCNSTSSFKVEVPESWLHCS